MSNVLIVIENAKDWKPYLPSAQVVTASDYLGSDGRFAEPGTMIINLCRGYKYLSIGYYCSLLAEARGQRVIPSVKAINDLSRKSIYSLDTDDLDAALQKALSKDESPLPVEFSLDIYFGVTNYKPLTDLARQIFETFRVPLLRVEFERRKAWRISAIKVQSLNVLDEHQEDQFADALENFNNKVWPTVRSRKKFLYDIAVLHNPEEKLPPSNARALKNFIRIGKQMGLQVELLEKKDFARLAEYDALFIRETTAINHHTYRFAKKAESEGMLVIDDPTSILRCTNKIYLADLLKTNKIPRPKTFVLQKDDIAAPEDLTELESAIGYPMVMKIPDGSFSRGVVKVKDRDEFFETAHNLFKQTALLLVQEYVYTDFDWRIGVLNQKPIYACQYFMSRGHWQITQHGVNGKTKHGAHKTVPISDAPYELVKHAVKAANLIGDGLYGVDMKMTAHGPVVIEVNDNPNLDAGVEDQYLGDDLYRIILEDFLRRLDLKHRRY